MKSVLIVDRSEDSRCILTSALESRGVRTLHASAARDGLRIAQDEDPDVILLDVDADADGDFELCEGFGRQSAETPLIVMGSARRKAASLPKGEYVRKPYHYGPLLRRIEELLNHSH